MAVSVGPVAVPLPRVPPAVPWVLGFVGLGLVYSAVRNQSPTEALRAVITGQNAATASRIDPEAGRRAGAGGNLTDTPTPDPSAGGGGGAGARGGAGDPPNLVSLSTGRGGATIRLGPSAAAGYRLWTAFYGAPIPCTSGYRSYADQAAAHAGDPDRFADPSTSKHVSGVAVDVDNDWLGALPAAEQTRLRLAARRAGWKQARYGRGEAGCGTKNDEPWHFSYVVCG